MSSSVTVVGGCYAEDCSFPRSTIYRGSGMRAAAILAGFGMEIAKRKSIKLEPASGSADIWFRYRHPLARPDVYPAVVSPAVYPNDVVADRALVFGMLEGRPRVLAKRVVYDPQDGFRARPFDENGSIAEELLIIASLSEGRALAAQEDPEQIARTLLSIRKCVGVIIKCGPQGALIATPTAQQWIRPFPSRRVWKIGSGDAFSAAFTYAWLHEGSTILDAAWFASRTVAEYVGTRAESFPPECVERIREEANAAATKTASVAREIPDATVYLAGPFFTTNQQWLVDEARFALSEMGFHVFSPIHEIGEGPPEIVAPADILALENSKLVFALLNGLDAGTLFEVGYARALGIPVVGLAEAVDERSLTMLLGSGCAISDDFATSIYTACWQLMGDV